MIAYHQCKTLISSFFLLMPPILRTPVSFRSPKSAILSSARSIGNFENPVPINTAISFVPAQNLNAYETMNRKSFRRRPPDKIIAFTIAFRDSSVRRIREGYERYQTKLLLFGTPRVTKETGQSYCFQLPQLS